MFKIEIKKEETITHGTQFPTRAECEEWYTDNLVAFPEGHISDIVDITALKVQEKEKADALKYLADTDWYIIRKTETGVEVPQEILTLRAEAREKAK